MDSAIVHLVVSTLIAMSSATHLVNLAQRVHTVSEEDANAVLVEHILNVMENV